MDEFWFKYVYQVKMENCKNITAISAPNQVQLFHILYHTMTLLFIWMKNQKKYVNLVPIISFQKNFLQNIQNFGKLNFSIPNQISKATYQSTEYYLLSS